MDAIETDAIEAYLTRLSETEQFSGRTRRYALLDYLVREELAGRGSEIKAYRIGVDVLERAEDFDPSTDSIVRVEVARLRDALALHYAQDGADDPFRIEIPKGTYRPTLTPADPAPAAEGTGPAARSPLPMRRALPVLALIVLIAAAIGTWQIRFMNTPEQVSARYLGFELPAFEGPRIAVLPFEAIPRGGDLEVLAYGLTVDTVTEVSRYRWLTIFFSSDRVPDALEPEPSPEWDFELRGQVRMDESNIGVTLQLAHADTGRILWTNAYRKSATVANMIDVQQSIASEIAVALAGREAGALARLEDRRVARDTTLSTTAYGCVLRTYSYWRTFDVAEHERVRGCLERAVVAQPDYAEAHAALAFIYLDEHRYGTNARQDYDPLNRAATHAERAYGLNSLSTLAAQALFTVHSQKGNAEAFRRIGSAALRNAPNNPELIADFGDKLAMDLGEWEAGTALAERAIALNPDAPGWYFIAPAYNAYRLGDYQDALDWSDRMNMPDFFLYHVVRLASFGALGRAGEAQASVAQLARLGYPALEDVVRYINDAGVEASLRERMTADVTSAFDMI